MGDNSAALLRLSRSSCTTSMNRSRTRGGGGVLAIVFRIAILLATWSTQGYAQTALGSDANQQKHFIQVSDGFDQWNSLQLFPGIFDEKVFRALDYVLLQSRKHKIRVLLSITNQWEDYGGITQYYDWAN